MSIQFTFYNPEFNLGRVKTREFNVESTVRKGGKSFLKFVGEETLFSLGDYTATRLGIGKGSKVKIGKTEIKGALYIKAALDKKAPVEASKEVKEVPAKKAPPKAKGASKSSPTHRGMLSNKLM